MDTIPSPRLGFLGGVFLDNHLASTDNWGQVTGPKGHWSESYIVVGLGLGLGLVRVRVRFRTSAPSDQ